MTASLRTTGGLLVLLAICGCPATAPRPATPRSGPSQREPRRARPRPRAAHGCDDPRVNAVLLTFRRAIATADGAALQSVTSPERGLALRQDQTNVTVTFAWRDLERIFVSAAASDWGENDISEEPLTGSFKAQMLPTLQRAVAGRGSEAVCGALLTGASAATDAWPSEYAALTLVSFYLASTDGTYDWVTWAAGIEYIDGQPYVVALVRYRYEM